MSVYNFVSVCVSTDACTHSACVVRGHLFRALLTLTSLRCCPLPVFALVKLLQTRWLESFRRVLLSLPPFLFRSAGIADAWHHIWFFCGLWELHSGQTYKELYPLSQLFSALCIFFLMKFKIVIKYLGFICKNIKIEMGLGDDLVARKLVTCEADSVSG